MDLMGFLAGIVIVESLILITILLVILKILYDISFIKGAFVSTVTEKLHKIEQIGLATMKACETFVDALENAMQGSPENMPQVFRTADGKHTATSIEEFIKKLEADPEYQNLADTIKNDLENAINTDDDDDDEFDVDEKKF
jgi:hypothetical protein